MTESEWLTMQDVSEMLRLLGTRLSRRKAVLMACAHNRPKFEELRDKYPKDAEGPLGLQAVEAAERFVSGQGAIAELDAVRSAIARAHDADRGGSDVMNPAYDARCWMSAILDVAAGTRTLADESMGSWPWCAFKGPDAAEIVREVCGNPFGPAVVIEPQWLVWNDGTVARLARRLYEERTFDQIPILADALEDAGCNDTGILDHCRRSAPHVRGCWVVDLLLAKE